MLHGPKDGDISDIILKKMGITPTAASAPATYHAGPQGPGPNWYRAACTSWQDQDENQISSRPHQRLRSRSQWLRLFSCRLFLRSCFYVTPTGLLPKTLTLDPAQDPNFNADLDLEEGGEGDELYEHHRIVAGLAARNCCASISSLLNRLANASRTKIQAMLFGP